MIPHGAARVLLVALGLLLSAAWLHATNFDVQQHNCPACGNTFEANAVGSSSTGGNDTDFMPLDLGTPAFVAEAVTCPKCLYSGHSADFGPAVQLTDKQKETLRRSLKPMLPVAPGTPSSQIPAVVRFDLVAQTYTALGRSDFEIGDALLNASWCVKVGFHPDLGWPEAKVQGLQDAVQKLYAELPAPDRAQLSMRDFDLARAEQFVQAAPARTGTARLACLYGATTCYWRYGEMQKVAQILPQFRDLLDSTAYARLAEQTSDAIARERSFQLRAADRFAKAASAGAGVRAATRPADDAAEDDDSRQPPSAGVLYYLTGELNRRAGNPAKAAEFFAQARKADHPDWLDELLQSQEKLLPAAQPVGAK